MVAGDVGLNHLDAIEFPLLHLLLCLLLEVLIALPLRRSLRGDLASLVHLLRVSAFGKTRCAFVRSPGLLLRLERLCAGSLGLPHHC